MTAPGHGRVACAAWVAVSLFAAAPAQLALATGVAAPTLSPAGAVHTAGSTQFSLSSTSPGATILYSTDGTLPLTVFSSPFVVPEAGRRVLRAIAGIRNATSGLLANSSDERAWPIFLQAPIAPGPAGVAAGGGSLGVCTSPSLLTGDSALATSGAASGGGEAGLFASFLPSRPGTYRVELTADDGCSVFRDSLTLDVRCPPETSTP
ncbi:unnamed protein product, partial [Symbiodinium microadriaticum]